MKIKLRLSGFVLKRTAVFTSVHVWLIMCLLKCFLSPFRVRYTVLVVLSVTNHTGLHTHQLVTGSLLLLFFFSFLFACYLARSTVTVLLHFFLLVKINIFSIVVDHCFLFDWLVPWVGRLKKILYCDWPPEWAGCSSLVPLPNFCAN